jgi:homeobox-leucine zipper protein
MFILQFLFFILLIVISIKAQLTLQSVMLQNMMDGHHQLAMMQQQHQNHGQQQAATSESDARGPRHDELLMESKSGSDNMEGGARSGGSGGEELQEEDLGLRQPARKKRYHRHTQHQIQELEALSRPSNLAS